MTVYIDGVFIFNLAADYIALLLSARICGTEIKRLRLLFASVLGAMYAVMTILTDNVYLSLGVTKVLFGAVIAFAAFGGMRSGLRAGVVFFLVSAAMGGVIAALTNICGGTEPDLRIGAAVFAAVYTVMTLAFRGAGRKRGEKRRIKLSLGTRTLELTALIDTGNALADPITGKRAVVVGLDDIAPLFPADMLEKLALITEKSAASALEELADRRFRLLPYRAVGVTDGLLLAFTPDTVEIGGRARRDMIVAISPNSVSDEAGSVALIGS